MDDQPVRLRPMTVADLPIVERWMRQPRVAEWWSDDPDAEVADIEDELRSGGATVYRIVELDGRPVGLLFRYRLEDYVEYVDELKAAHVDLPANAWSMDYLLGEEDVVGRGVGSAMIRAGCDELWTSDAKASCVMVPVHADNVRSWSALRRVGFTRVGGVFEMEPDTAAHDGRHVVYSMRRPQQDATGA